MNKYKSDDYKLSAVKYYLNNNDSLDKLCSIFDCKKSTLKGWVDIYKTTKNITRKNRKPISYKINKDQVKTAVNMILGIGSSSNIGHHRFKRAFYKNSGFAVTDR